MIPDAAAWRQMGTPRLRLELLLEIGARINPDLIAKVLIERAIHQGTGLARWRRFCAGFESDDEATSIRELLDDEYAARR